MGTLDRSVAWLLFGFGVLHCGMTFLIYPQWSSPAMWFFSGGLAMMYCAALNLLRVRYAGAAPGVRIVSLFVNVSLVAFVLVYAAGRGFSSLINPRALLLVGGLLAATAFSLVRRGGARNEVRAAEPFRETIQAGR